MSLYCTDGDFANAGQIRLWPFSYHVFTCKSCSCCECAVDAGHGSKAELSSPVVQQGKVGNMAMVTEEQRNQSACLLRLSDLNWSDGAMLLSYVKLFRSHAALETRDIFINGTGAD